MKKKTVECDFEFMNAYGTAKRLPRRADMIEWMTTAADRDLAVAIRFVGNEESRELNRTYRGKDRPTNVLTFDYAHEPVAQADLVVCVPVIVTEAAEQGKSFRAHLAHMLIHGVLHAQGWDHATDEQAEEMESLETRIMLSLGFPNPYADRAQAH